MVNTLYLKHSLGVIILICFLHIIGIKFHLYWEFWWFDIVQHFLGGVWVALTSLWFVYFSGIIKRPFRPKEAVVLAFISILVIGTGWEVFEYIFGIAVIQENYCIDTTMDFIMDFLGAGASTYYIIKKQV